LGRSLIFQTALYVYARTGLVSRGFRAEVPVNVIVPRRERSRRNNNMTERSPFAVFELNCVPLFCVMHRTAVFQLCVTMKIFKKSRTPLELRRGLVWTRDHAANSLVSLDPFSFWELTMTGPRRIGAERVRHPVDALYVLDKRMIEPP